MDLSYHQLFLYLILYNSHLPLIQIKIYLIILIKKFGQYILDK